MNTKQIDLNQNLFVGASVEDQWILADLAVLDVKVDEYGAALPGENQRIAALYGITKGQLKHLKLASKRFPEESRPVGVGPLKALSVYYTNQKNQRALDRVSIEWNNGDWDIPKSKLSCWDRGEEKVILNPECRYVNDVLLAFDHGIEDDEALEALVMNVFQTAAMDVVHSGVHPKDEITFNKLLFKRTMEVISDEN